MVGVGVIVGVELGVGVFVGVDVIVAVGVGVRLDVGVEVGVDVDVGVMEGVGVGLVKIDKGVLHPAISALSMRGHQIYETNLIHRNTFLKSIPSL
jgi:hypothetical protein